MGYNENAMIAALNNKETRHFFLACLITADASPGEIKNQLEFLPSIINAIKRLDGIKDKKEILNRLEDALEIRKRGYDEITKQNLVDWRDNNGNTN